MKENKMELQKTSKTSMLKMMILRAWRERWNVAVWGINIKSVLPRGVSGDVYNLADCILQQALVGSNANPLVLNYLKHSLCAHLVSHAAVLRRISKYDHYDRTFCITALLEFLEGIIDGVTCRNKPEESILPGAIVSLVYWLLQIFGMVAKNYEINGEISAELLYMFEHSCVVAEKLASNQFLMGILYVGRQEDPNSYEKIQDKYAGIKNTLDSCNFSPQSSVVEKCLQQLACIDVQHLTMPCLDRHEIEPITYCVQPLLSVELLRNPCNDTSYYVNEMLKIKRMKKLSPTRLLYEIVRAGFISLSHMEETSHDPLIAAFTFFQVPLIIKQLHAVYHAGEEEQLPTDYIPELVDAFELLLEDTLLLNSLDSKCLCNITELLLSIWQKQHLLTETHVKHFTAQRESISLVLQKRENTAQTSVVNFIIRAEVPLGGILKTLSTDYNKVQEALMSVLCQVLVGNSFDLILTVASVEGRLKAFAKALIQCNQNSKQVPGEIGKTMMIRSTLFDVSFLMLTFIVQTYGSDEVLSESNGDSFFEMWMRECMAERNKPKNPASMLALCDDNIVDELLLSLSKPEAQLKTSNLTWQDICINLSGVMNHVLIAWEKDTLSSADVKNILDNIQRRLFSFSVCATSFLCAYMNSVRETEFLKPLNMIQQFLALPSADEMSSQDSVKERLGLSFQIIRTMQFDAHPSINQKARANTLTQNLISHAPLIDQFREIWKLVLECGWLPMRATQVLESLLRAGGPVWLVKQLVDEIFKCKYTRDMTKTMDIVFAILHLDIERTTEVLLTSVVPAVMEHRQGEDINEPQSLVLARLCVYCIISALERRQRNVRVQNKRSRPLNGDEDNMASNAKLRKMEDDCLENSCTNDFMPNNSLLLGSGGISPGSIGLAVACESPTVLGETLSMSVQHIFKVFLQFVSTDELSPKVYFVYQFISLLVEYGGERVHCVLQLLPQNLIQNLLKVLITEDASVGLISRLYDLRVNTSRQAAVSDLCLWRNIDLKKLSVQL